MLSVEVQKGVILILFKDVPLRTRRAISLYVKYVVLNGALLNSVNALLALSRRCAEFKLHYKYKCFLNTDYYDNIAIMRTADKGRRGVRYWGGGGGQLPPPYGFAFYFSLFGGGGLLSSVTYGDDDNTSNLYPIMVIILPQNC